MFEGWIQTVLQYNLISVMLLAVLSISVIQGMFRGASRSAGRLFSLISGGVLALLSLLLAIPLTMALSPKVGQWMATIALPERTLSKWEQVYYTLVTAMRDFSLMRVAVLFILSYWLIRSIMGLLSIILMGRSNWLGRLMFGSEGPSTIISRLTGALIGAVIGGARCIMIIALLFIVVTLYPNSGFSRYVEASPVYRQGAQTIIEPISGNLIEEQLPVFTRSVETQLNGILQRKYEIIDANISDSIEEAAVQIVSGAKTDEDKARLLYDWIGTRIVYDYDKVTDYEQNNHWREQNTEQTFDTRLGVCIDFSRLYAVMARSQGLQVKVITGLGYNGQGGYGPHAWNEVYLSEQDKWVPLDSTWAKSGDWFNPTDFSETHIADKII